MQRAFKGTQVTDYSSGALRVAGAGSQRAATVLFEPVRMQKWFEFLRDYNAGEQWTLIDNGNIMENFSVNPAGRGFFRG